jgi:peptide chain release factor subunit 3
MANWQNPNLNLDAPEFVPKFGSGPSPPSNQSRPPSMGQHPAGMPGSGNPNQFNQQHFNNFQQQQFQQQQYRQPFNQQQYQQQQQQFHYQQQLAQQQQQLHQQQQFFNNQAQNNNNQHLNSNPSVPVEKIAPASVNQLVNSLLNLNTNPNSTITTTTTTTNNNNTITKAAVEEKKPVPEVSPPPPVVEVKKPTADSIPVVAKPVEPSVSVEKISEKPSQAPIKEEEWEKDENNDNDQDNNDNDEDATTEKGGADEAVIKPKKAIVIRELKPKKEPINVIFCGHVDAGKSTIGGQIMFQTGMVDKRTLEKYEREAKEQNRESWYLSWALDTSIEERAKGKTVEVGRAFFETEKKHFIILDAPGHRGFVPNMIGGASQADIAVLVISARKGEFETGFERGGQTREHAMLVKTAGVKYLIVLVNKMDDSTVNWDEERYNEIKDKLTPYLKKCGFQPNKEITFMPCSGYTGAFIKDAPDAAVCDWYKGPCFIEFLETMPVINRTSTGPLRMPIIDKYKDMGTVIMGKIESGMVKLSDKFLMMPNKVKVEVVTIYCEEEETDSAMCGENVKLKLKGIDDEEISAGSVLCSVKDFCSVARIFDAQVVILECPSIICPGFNSILHIHAATAEVQLTTIIGLVDKKTGEKDFKSRQRFIKQDQIAICRFEVTGGQILCMEPFKLFPQLGRFTLRYENKTVAVGKVLKVIE